MKSVKNLVSAIRQQEGRGRALEVSAEERASLLQTVNQYTEAFLETLPLQKTYEKEGGQRLHDDEAFEIKTGTKSIGALVSLLHNRVDRIGLNPPSGGQLGYIPTGGIYTAALGDYIAAVTNRYAGVFYASPGAVRLENALIRWVAKLVGFQEGFGGNLASGGSIANLIAIAAAREVARAREKDPGNWAIYICQQAHHSILKALKVTGLDACALREIPLDEDYRMDMRLLRKQIRKDKKEGLLPFLLCANAGSTDVGAVDPLEEMAKIAKEFKLWFHVDAAYGGFFLLTREGKEKLKGIEQADSVILDPHKGLFLPYGLGVVLVKNVKYLLAANNFDANYMQDAFNADDEFSPSQLSPELSKHFRGLRMWLPLKLHGIKPFAANLEEKLLLARYFYERVRGLGFKTGPWPDLSVVIFWYEPDSGEPNDFNRRILARVQEDGRLFISSTTIDKKFLLRFAALSFRTHLPQVHLLLDQLEAAVSSLQTAAENSFTKTLRQQSKKTK